MIIALRSRFSIDDMVAMFSWVITGMAVLFFLYFLGTLIRVPVMEKVMQPPTSPSEFRGAMIFTGPLAIKENTRSALAIALEQKLILLAQSVRPDVKIEDRVYCIGVQGSGEKLMVKEGEPFFASITSHPNGGVESVSFVQDGEGITMVPHILDDHSLLLRFEKMEVILQTSKDSIQQQGNLAEIEELSHVKWWGRDRLFEVYGGKEYYPLSQKEKVEIEGEFLFVDSGDFLSRKEGKWRVLKHLEEASPSIPLAQIHSTQQGRLLFEVWDENGFLIFQKEVSPQSRGQLRITPEELFRDPRQRSAKQVSCIMENKRMTLKEGDWLVKGKLGWSKLKTISEIEAFLSHKQNGELLIVDHIDSSGQLNGHYFDEKRTQMQLITLRVTRGSPKNVTLSPKRRRHLSKL